ncbi:MAG: NADH-quinone oxidoreductase subunit K [Bdellovibrionaceae bacterium]|nr:NADH-quinone oxidoreductase subunit K [Pseudobdellovibrionaceae bacterium]
MNIAGTPLQFVFALTVGFLFAAGLWLMMRKNFVKIVVGFTLLGHAVNLTVFSSGGLVATNAPLIAAGETTLATGSADPLPQALVLTAIVIGFAAQIFLIVLMRGAAALMAARPDSEIGGDE